MRGHDEPQLPTKHLSRSPPPLPEIPDNPDHRHVALSLASFVVWLRDQWPPLVVCIERHEAILRAIDDKLAARGPERRGPSHWAAFAIGIFLGVGCAALWIGLHQHP